MAVDYGQLGLGVASAAAPYLAPNPNLNASQQARQANINRENDYAATLARSEALDPLRAFKEQQRGQNLATMLQSGGSGLGAGFDGGLTDPVSTQSATGHTENSAGIIAALLNPETYSMRKDENGNTVFDPLAFNPLNQARAEGDPSEGGYTRDGEKLRFGREGSEGDGVEDEVRGAASGALSGAGTGATIGSAFGPGPGTAIGAGVGALAGVLTGYFRGRGMDKEGRVNTQANLNTLNDFNRDMAARRALNPNAALMSMITGENMAQGAESGGNTILGGYGGGVGGEATARRAGGNTQAQQDLVNAMRNPETFSMVKGPDGSFTFDPESINPLDLAFMDGKAKEGGYSRSGDKETRYFGRSGSGGGGRKRPSGAPGQPQRDDDDQLRAG